MAVSVKKTATKKLVKAPAKKPVAKKPVAKKAPAKKAPVKKPVAKLSKPAAKPTKIAPKTVVKKPAAKPTKPVVKPATKKPAIPVKKVEVPAQQPAAAVKAVSADKPTTPEEMIAFVMDFAEQRKQQVAEVDSRNDHIDYGDVRLSRRPTTRAQGEKTEKFSAADLEDFRRRLFEERERALKGVNAIRAMGENSSDDRESDGGDGTAQDLKLQALGQVGMISRTISQIEAALHRIEEGTYGICENCGQLIRKPRLLNQPFVLTCMECQREMESKRI